MDHAPLAGRIALITGAAQGIGRAAASVFAAHGARLVLADVEVAGGEAAAEAIRSAGGEAVFVRADVSNAADVEALVAHAVARFGRLDCALNNAGIAGELAPLADYDEVEWDRVLATNLQGVFLCMKHEIRQMLAQRGGAIVNVASIAGLVGDAIRPAYVAAKHGVVGLTKSAALAYAKHGVRINALCPGATRTPLLEDAMRRIGVEEAQVAACKPIGRIGEPHEIAQAAAWMCSDAAAFMIGHAMVLDGGFVVG
jgi:NAD(P)-dependent dehydrogenase (short-subunit alcohol dehydrogenase family)